jgi:hypothetical protein
VTDDSGVIMHEDSPISEASRMSTGKEAFLALAGAWHDDPDVERFVRHPHRRHSEPGADRVE